LSAVVSTGAGPLDMVLLEVETAEGRVILIVDHGDVGFERLL
jgi:hypothetical protein